MRDGESELTEFMRGFKMRLDSEPRTAFEKKEGLIQVRGASFEARVFPPRDQRSDDPMQTPTISPCDGCSTPYDDGSHSDGHYTGSGSSDPEGPSPCFLTGGVSHPITTVTASVDSYLLITGNVDDDLSVGGTVWEAGKYEYLNCGVNGSHDITPYCALVKAGDSVDIALINNISNTWGYDLMIFLCPKV